MRICRLLVGLALAVPSLGSAQQIRPDSIGLANAIAKAIREPIKKNGAPGAAAAPAASLEPASVRWNTIIVNELKALDSTLVVRRPSKETLRVNTIRITMVGDSASATIGMSRCFGARFVGSSVEYAFKKTGAEWRSVHEQRGFAARGPCPK